MCAYLAQRQISLRLTPARETHMDITLTCKYSKISENARVSVMYVLVSACVCVYVCVRIWVCMCVCVCVCVFVCVSACQVVGTSILMFVFHS